MNVIKETVSTVRNGHATVGTARSQLTTESIIALKGVLVRAPGADDPAANTAPIWIGGAGVTANNAATTGGIPILPGAGLMIPVEDPSKLYVISTSADQDLAWMVL